MADVDSIVAKLREGDYYARSTAARALGEVGGEKAETALIEALNDKDDWVKEYAAEALGKLKSERAVEALGKLLGPGNYKVRSSAAEALGKIGGDQARELLEPLGEDPDTWVREAAVSALKKISGEEPATEPESVSPAAQSARGMETEPELEMSDDAASEPEPKVKYPRRGPADRTPYSPEEIIEIITRDTSIKCKAMRSGFLLRVPVGGHRYQKVRLKFDSTDEDGSPIVQIFTLISPAKPEHYQLVLKLNPSFSYGAIGIVKIDGKEFFAIMNTLLEENVDPKAIEKSVRTLATKGDALEKKLIRKDIW